MLYRWCKIKRTILIKYRMTNHQKKNPYTAMSHCHSRQFLNGRLLFTWSSEKTKKNQIIYFYFDWKIHRSSFFLGEICETCQTNKLEEQFWVEKKNHKNYCFIFFKNISNEQHSDKTFFKNSKNFLGEKVKISWNVFSS